MLLVQDGTLDGRRPRRHATSPDVPQAWRDITLRHLLTHTSGLRREAPAADLEQGAAGHRPHSIRLRRAVAVEAGGQVRLLEPGLLRAGRGHHARQRQRRGTSSSRGVCLQPLGMTRTTTTSDGRSAVQPRVRLRLEGRRVERRSAARGAPPERSVRLDRFGPRQMGRRRWTAIACCRTASKAEMWKPVTLEWRRNVSLRFGRSSRLPRQPCRRRAGTKCWIARPVRRHHRRRSP